MRSQRPLLPKIDPSVGFRAPVYQGEFTPASSGHNSMISPVSAGSGPKSPWPAVRKGSLPGPRRPPSPELTNLDCAFPPFPLPARAATTKRRDRSATERSETKRSRSREGRKGAAHSSRRPGLIREGSSNTSGTKSSDAVPTLKQSRPTSPLSNEVKLEGHQADPQKPPNVPLPVSISVATTESLPGVSLALQSSTENTQPKPPDDARSDPSLSQMDVGGTMSSKSESRPVELWLNERARAETEPAYKSRRPAPIVSNHEITPLVKSPTAPQPSPSGSFGRSLGRLFSRRRSQSATSRRDVVRLALSDESDSFDKSFAGQNMFSPGSERSFFTAEPSPLATSPLKAPEPSPSHEESLKALEGLALESAAEPLKRSGQVLPSDLDVTTSPEPFETSENTSAPEGSELIEALRRVSIDSASSYGSIGFTERTTSSRSTAPQMDPMPIDPYSSPDSALLKSGIVDIPAPLRPKLPEVSPDSPTDPLFQEGRLSPIPDSAYHPQDSLDALPSIHVEPETNPEPAQTPEPRPVVRNKAKLSVPNKGVCRGCAQLILVGQKSVSSADGRLTGRYHKDCFVCQTCKSAFPTAEFYVHNDHPYCAHHYHELENSLCATCGKGIEGLYMETANVAGRGKEKHHPECLKCTTCKIRLDHDYFELSGKVYCERDAFRLASSPKSQFNAPSRPSPLVREYISSGDPGLVKGRNFPERRTTRLMTMD
ncbi:hypothetical protein G647_01399 [Cladophialophora carrionii CBS 160.54]|uniref:LIM zinc-binding domain-containing protein n=1 Tax=Cladophialophora carrionii CBS 160.54 TaxID=1279043 RepID=V9DSL5_9EURO|nr:uncharacterized protein G647_01399 [Cladophialophora carrionii CBS 160.54]ETI28947.1 hypothetical protein G647_01399 [Cladophialophora carrionii CBS 160.54]